MRARAREGRNFVSSPEKQTANKTSGHRPGVRKARWRSAAGSIAEWAGRVGQLEGSDCARASLSPAELVGLAATGVVQCEHDNDALPASRIVRKWRRLTERLPRFTEGAHAAPPCGQPCRQAGAGCAEIVVLTLKKVSGLADADSADLIDIHRSHYPP